MTLLLMTACSEQGKEIFDFLVEKLQLPGSPEKLTVSFREDGRLVVDYSFSPVER